MPSEQPRETSVPCAVCEEELDPTEPDGADGHIPPVPEELTTTQSEIDTPSDAHEAFDLAIEYGFSEGAVVHIGGNQMRVTAADDIPTDSSELDAIHKIQPYVPYETDGSCLPTHREFGESECSVEINRNYSNRVQ